MAAPLLESTDQAFERLYESYARVVYRYALAVMRNPADAEDITQTTFLNAYRAMKAGDQPLKPRHWLLKIAHNACRMRWVWNSRRPQEVPLDAKAEQIVVPERERPNVRAVLNELAKLPFTQRSALVMRELEGRSYDEIAETLGVTVPAVEALLVRARRSLRLRRSAINVLGAVQLPASLESFFGSGAVATGGALAAGGVVFKAAAVLVAGLVAGGAGYTAVGATRGSKSDRPVPRPGVRSTSAPATARVMPTPYVTPLRARVGAGKTSAPKHAGETAARPQESPPPVGIDAQPAAVPSESPAPSVPSPFPPMGPPPTTTAAPAQPPPPVPQPAVPAPVVPPVPAPVVPPVPAPALPPQPPPLPQIPPLPQVPPAPTVPALPAIPHIP
jgi:RNA polymerase sigma factor (sigma-70 family)